MANGVKDAASAVVVVTDAERYPQTLAALRSLLTSSGRLSPGSAAALKIGESGVLGPAVLRARPALSRPRPSAAAQSTGSADEERPDVDTLLGELLDMVLVGADEGRSGRPEVHLQFKSDVFGGLHLRLVKQPQGLEAFFIVDDAATRRAVQHQIEDLVAHLRGRGFAVTEAHLDVAG